jgi:energy-coupling factor transporter ATP-binding protein EcfA2
MSIPIERFVINDLHSFRTIDIPIHDNKLLLVGENGSGKSTVASLMYFFLTRQWHRMLDYEFRSIVAHIGSRIIEISHNDIEEFFEGIPPRAYRGKHRTRFPREFEELMLSVDPEEVLKSRSRIFDLAHERELPVSMVRDYLEFISGARSLPGKLKAADGAIREMVTDQVLFLPTYRRIEQDLRAIFPGLEKEIRSVRRHLRPPESGVRFIELVEFGMEDVEKAISDKMTEIKDNVRDSLNKLTGTYLRDVIQGAYRTEELLANLTELDESTIESIFGRIPKAILSSEELATLRSIIAKTKEEGNIHSEDKVVAHFLTQLIELHRDQEEDERDVRDFVDVCNGYLTGKQLHYNNQAFEISVLQQVSADEYQTLAMRDLSSGEKQIVSLFSHIYMSGPKAYTVIIDEPELSLSVPWQKRFLPDILETGLCSTIIAVTHSPFVYDNSLDAFAHSLEPNLDFSDDLS